jgi:hypothetical protein
MAATASQQDSHKKTVAAREAPPRSCKNLSKGARSALEPLECLKHLNGLLSRTELFGNFLGCQQVIN